MFIACKTVKGVAFLVKFMIFRCYTENDPLMTFDLKVVYNLEAPNNACLFAKVSCSLLVNCRRSSIFSEITFLAIFSRSKIK